MSNYLSWNKKIINDFSEKNVNDMYEHGYVFTRVGKGIMNQTRSVRINLNDFELSSENRRVLRKTEDVKMEIIKLPHPDYDWRIHKLGHDYYSAKFGEKTFSANKIKELLTEESNFNLLLKYSINEKIVGYCICYAGADCLHYTYPFYDLEANIANLGIGMMTKAIVWAKENGKKFVCLGSAKDSAAIYKTQFNGFEWFDKKNWQTDIDELKNVLK
ncbi:MAG: hypothetical protein COU29_03805 [Candidatus Magasanikbacteria bacterium CG10_big_fil_rev_8_21_14_0_10_36_32]|uniref:N-end rule aminoacyl transferase C-terminal domain-containing protein n=1 Tax=Candidatus Magasanikbacteria bacterium CG10_big_fil_rev_8_21_14_0_10_36_32 TaxID=1974646 RepID=A0A2M6W5M1_9BACT|nr:MAG: hypothetical protein COU29_03805 [Candidatus Magasanikbacteria bacterium CG10_big_fil_rev_8_21_14_0_10_36_32]